MATEAYIFNADVYHPRCIIEELIGTRELAPAARDMPVSEALWWAASANAINMDDECSYDSGEWPKSVLYGVGGEEVDEDNPPHCGRCLGLIEDDPKEDQ